MRHPSLFELRRTGGARVQIPSPRPQTDYRSPITDYRSPIPQLPIRDRAVGSVQHWDRRRWLSDLCDQLSSIWNKLNTEARSLIWPHFAVTEIKRLRQVWFLLRLRPQYLHENRAGEGPAGVYQSCSRDRAGEVRYKPDIVRLTECSQFVKLGHSSCIRERNPRIVDQMSFDQLVNIPTIAKLFSYRNRNFNLLPERPINAGVL